MRLAHYPFTTPPKQRPVAKQKRQHPEEDLQRTLVQYLELMLKPEVEWTAIPNGDLRPRGIGGKLKAMGVRPGWMDLIFFAAGKLFGLELKAKDGKRSAESQRSPNQRIVHARLTDQGAHIATVNTFEDAVAQLKAWKLLKGGG